ncbi:hypothetical protein DQ392_24820 [Streptomyces reniochalinae]|uniref:Uncharacterized protein n=1 Tax=Streptomyces reniochalinae TaxID=2250578 RepID=A0A367EBF7_9ACTN|nr:hypothetical protein DQ392_24820 [Streptomyces reniochalinae]
MGAAGRVTHPHEGFVGVRGAGEFQAQSLARIKEPAGVADTEAQGLRLRFKDTLDAPVVDDGDRPGVVPLQGLVDGLEGADEVAGTLPAGQDAALVVLVGGDGQPQMFGFFLGGDFGGEGGLVSTGAGGIALGCGHADMFEVQFHGHQSVRTLGDGHRERAPQGAGIDRAVGNGLQPEPLSVLAVRPRTQGRISATAVVGCLGEQPLTRGGAGEGFGDGDGPMHVFGDHPRVLDPPPPNASPLMRRETKR